jgi:hypothetical protein
LKRSHPQIGQIFRKRKEPHAKIAKDAKNARKGVFLSVLGALGDLGVRSSS